MIPSNNSRQGKTGVPHLLGTLLRVELHVRQAFEKLLSCKGDMLRCLVVYQSANEKAQSSHVELSPPVAPAKLELVTPLESLAEPPMAGGGRYLLRAGLSYV